MAGYDVRGRVALITGAVRGIGFETARQLHARGASVALVDLQRDEVEDAAERIGADRAVGFAADVTDAADIAAVVDTTAERFGGLDIVVANAGIAPPAATMRVVDIDAFERVIEVDLLGVWRTVRPAIPHVIARGGQVIVVASVYAFTNGVAASPYAIAKAGVEQLGRALRVELAPYGASASVAYFGFIDTDMVRDSFADPIAVALNERLPGFMLRRLPPATAAEAIVAGIETRAPRIIRPRWWIPLSMLRGCLNPLLDRWMERDARLREPLAAADRDDRATALGGAAKAPRTAGRR
jgi:NAD(P)-dependent dehydrogenase (short-subunit alcohol dehydrogenase family)